MSLNTTSFFNSNEVHISSRMNEYMKKNFGYEVEGDIDTLKEAKKSLEAEQIELKKHSYMNAKYMENMLMIETISSLVKAHSNTSIVKEDDKEVEYGDTEEDLAKALGMTEDELFSLAEDVGIDQYGGLTKDNYEDVMQHIIDNFEDYKQIGESPIIDDSLVKEEEVNEGTREELTRLIQTNDSYLNFPSNPSAADFLGDMKIILKQVFSSQGTKVPEEIADLYNKLLAYHKDKELQAKNRKIPSEKSNHAPYYPENMDEEYVASFADPFYDAFRSTADALGIDNLEEETTEEVNEKDVTVDNEGNIAGYLDYIDECIDKISPDNVSEMAYRIQNAVDDIRTRELDLKASLIRDKFNENDEDEELLNKIAMWIYHESDSPISEIEHLLKKSGAVGDYEDALFGVEESKESIKENDEEKGPEHYRYVNDSQLSRVQDRLRLTISELDHAIQYRAKNSHLFFNTGDKAGTGDLYGIKDKLEKIDDEWDDQTELYGM